MASAAFLAFLAVPCPVRQACDKGRYHTQKLDSKPDRHRRRTRCRSVLIQYNARVGWHSHRIFGPGSVEFVPLVQLTEVVGTQTYSPCSVEISVRLTAVFLHQMRKHFYTQSGPQLY
jgi:hypothetical protein